MFLETPPLSPDWMAGVILSGLVGSAGWER